MPLPLMTAADQFMEISARFTKCWVDLQAFRQVARVGIPASQETLGERMLLYLRTLEHPEFEPMYSEEEIKSPEQAAEAWTKDAVSSAHAAVDAASIVFAHTLVETAAMGYLSVTRLVAERDWMPFVKDRKWTLADIQQHGFEKLLRSSVLDEYERLEKDGLTKKVLRLMQVCRPAKNWGDGFALDEDELNRIDRLRRDVVHGDLLGHRIETIDDDIEHLRKLCAYLGDIVFHRYSDEMFG
jgi:hypothetical protein